LVTLVRVGRIVIEVVRAIAEEKLITISEMAAAAIEATAAIEIVIMIPAHLAHAERRAGWPRHPAWSKRRSTAKVRPRPSCARPDKTASSESAYTACTATDAASHDMCAAPTKTAAIEAASHDSCTAANEAPTAAATPASPTEASTAAAKPAASTTARTEASTTAAMTAAPTAAVSLSEPSAGGRQHQNQDRSDR
jgi:hypothetical protein